ncbi:NiFeSe hydrogenase small subunit [Desulfovibrio inopinatus]|uniref:NiFeSe hydrogenase small subunit n=1 Tax=Desulfovibrio inopinatus TaxID=102109 RepID=UPI0003F6FA68|nr:NiFeSe hydrogenase small subunit [Desulfovibrio inopinatus]
MKRRDFVKLCTGTVAGFGVSQMFHPGLVKMLEAATGPGKPPVVWIQGQGCTGCSVSLLNSLNPSIADVVLKVISLEYHPTVMDAEGGVAFGHLFEIAEKFEGKFYLAIEGAIPVGEDGHFCIVGDYNEKEFTMVEAIKAIAPKAAGVMALGTCAAGGGIPAAEGNLTQSMSASKFFEQEGIKTPLINVPGCPPHPDWMVGTLVHLLTKGIPELDAQGRPTMFFGELIHDNCPYLKYFEEDVRQTTFTEMKDTSCRADMGCKGPLASADCYKRRWNNGVNWCVENAICIGCVETDWPDGYSPFYEPVV